MLPAVTLLLCTGEKGSKSLFQCHEGICDNYPDLCCMRECHDADHWYIKLYMYTAIFHIKSTTLIQGRLSRILVPLAEIERSQVSYHDGSEGMADWSLSATTVHWSTTVVVL